MTPPNPRDLLRDAFRDHHRAVFAVAVHECGPGAADDVTVDVFVRLGRDPERLAAAVGAGDLRALLLTMTRDYGSVSVLGASDVIGAFDAGLEASDIELGVSGMNAGASVGAPRTPVRVALDALPRNEQDAIATALYGGCTYRETADVLAEGEATVMALMRSGLRRMAGLLGDSAPAIAS